MANDTDATLRMDAPLAAPVVARAPSSEKVGFSLRYKIFSAMLLLVLLVLFAVLAVIRIRATKITRNAIDAELAEAGPALETFLAERIESQMATVRQLADDPNTMAAITTGDPETVLDYAISKQQEAVGGKYLMVLDDEGFVLARSDRPELEPGDYLGDVSPLFERPLSGEEAFGYGGGDEVLLLTSAPVREGGDFVVGVLVAASVVDREVADRIREVGRAHATFISDDRGDVSVVATTLASRDSEALLSGLAATGALTGKSTVGPLEVPIGSDPEIVLALPLQTASGETLGWLIASRSLHEEMAAFREIQSTLIWVGLGACLLALFVSLLLANRMTRPLIELADVTRQVIAGNLDVQMPRTADDEIGLVARSLDKVLVDLRQKDELEDYIQSLGVNPADTIQASAAARSASTLPAAPGVELAPGMTFAGRYAIDKILGAGAMGQVFRAQDLELEEAVAIKTIRAEALDSDPDAISRFKTETRLARKITDRHVLRTFDFNEAAGTRYLTMEYFESVTLKQLLNARGRFPTGPGIHLAKQMCQGLVAAHEQGVVHRDIKPQNMLVNGRGDLKLMDFGISTLSSGRNDLTEVGVVIGTPDYMSPEQAQAQPLDHRSDIYSLGVVLFELFCGRVPYVGDTTIAIVLSHIQKSPPPPRSLNPDIHPEIEQIILAAMQRSVEERPQTVGEIYEALLRIST